MSTPARLFGLVEWVVEQLELELPEKLPVYAEAPTDPKEFPHLIVYWYSPGEGWTQGLRASSSRGAAGVQITAVGRNRQDVFAALDAARAIMINLPRGGPGDTTLGAWRSQDPPTEPEENGTLSMSHETWYAYLGGPVA